MNRETIVDLVPSSARVAKRALTAWIDGEHEIRLLRRLCRSDELAIDVGANRGVYTWHFALWSAGVVAFEPQPALAKFLEKAFGDRIRVEPVALSDEDGEAVLRVPLDRMEDGRATIELANKLSQRPTREIRVARRRLDSYAFDRIGIIKIDVEGHELAMLNGARSILARDRPALIVEAEECHRPGAFDSVSNYLSPLGYRSYVWRGSRLRDPASAKGLSRARGRRGSDAAVSNFVFLARRYPDLEPRTR